MPITLDDIEPSLSEAEDAFRHGGQEHEEGLDVSDAGMVYLRKGYRSLSGADRLLADDYYTLVIEAAFTSIEKTLMFWLIHEGYQGPSNPPDLNQSIRKLPPNSTTHRLNDDVPDKVVSDRANACQAVLEQYHDRQSERERMEQRWEFLDHQ
jgi:hypothetical protein